MYFFLPYKYIQLKFQIKLPTLSKTQTRATTPPPQPMAPSTPPPPLDTSNTVASTTTTTTRPVFQYPARPPNPHPIYSPPPTRLPSNPNPNYPQLAPRPPHPHPQDPTQLLYPVASSGRGFISRPVPMPVARPSPRPPYVFPYLDQGQGNPGFVRPNHLPHVLLGSGPGSAVNATGAGVMPSVVNGIPIPTSHHPKVLQFSFPFWVFKWELNITQLY